MGTKNGQLIGLTLENFSKITGKSSKTIKKVINKFLELDMLVVEGNIYKVKNWDKYQSVGIDGKVKKIKNGYCEEKKLENGKLNTKEEKNKIKENNKEEKEQSRKDGENGFRTFKGIE